MIQLFIKKVSGGLFEGTVDTDSLPEFIQEKMGITDETPSSLQYSGEYTIKTLDKRNREAQVKIIGINIMYGEYVIEIPGDSDVFNAEKIAREIESRIDWISYWGEDDGFDYD